MSIQGTQDLTAERNSVWLVYILHGLGIFTGGLTSVAAIIVNHVKFNDIRNPIMISHFKWQIKTFWWGLLWGVVSLALTYLFVGLLGFVALSVWFIYRIVAGMVNLNSGRGMYGQGALS